MAAYKKPQPWNEEKIESLRGEKDQVNFIYIRFERWQVVGLRKARRGQDVP